MKRLIMLTGAVLAFAPLGAVADGDIAAGQAKAKQVCAACHGENGDRPLQPDYPILSGQHVDYLARALHDYRSGARKNAVMSGQAQALSSKDIEDVAAWYASRRGPLYIKR